MNRTRRPHAIGLALTLILVLAACATEGPAATTPAPTSTATPTASASPSAEPAATPTEEESPSATPAANPGGFTVTPHPEADSLFLDRDDCQNLEDGYQLQFPEEWYTNTEIGDVPACSWFSPGFYEVDDPSDAPDEIAITIELLQGDRGYTDEPISQEEVTVGATQDAVRTEVESDGDTMYEYVVQLGPSPEEGPNLLARTATDMGGDYELNRAVLDRIMATIEFIGTIQ